MSLTSSSVDDREPPSTFRRLTDAGLVWEKKRLASGDIATPLQRAVGPATQVGIELKTWRDLIASLRRVNKTDRKLRLFSEVDRMFRDYDMVVILVYGGLYLPGEGTWRRSSSVPFSIGVQQADNALLALQRQGVYVAHCPDPEALGVRVKYILQWFDKVRLSTRVGDYAAIT